MHQQLSLAQFPCQFPGSMSASGKSRHVRNLHSMQWLQRLWPTCIQSLAATFRVPLRRALTLIMCVVARGKPWPWIPSPPPPLTFVGSRLRGADQTQPAGQHSCTTRTPSGRDIRPVHMKSLIQSRGMICSTFALIAGIKCCLETRKCECRAELHNATCCCGHSCAALPWQIYVDIMFAPSSL